MKHNGETDGYIKPRIAQNTIGRNTAGRKFATLTSVIFSIFRPMSKIKRLPARTISLIDLYCFFGHAFMRFIEIRNALKKP